MVIMQMLEMMRAVALQRDIASWRLTHDDQVPFNGELGCLFLRHIHGGPLRLRCVAEPIKRECLTGVSRVSLSAGGDHLERACVAARRRATLGRGGRLTGATGQREASGSLAVGPGEGAVVASRIAGQRRR